MRAYVLQPPRRRRAKFLLTPLVDVMFLLLIFFMLSSETSLFTLLPINAPANTGSAAPDALAAAPKAELLASIGRATVRLNGVEVTDAGLMAALSAFRQQGFTTAALMPTAEAEAQDIITVIEIFEAAEFGAVRLVALPVAGP